MARNGIGFEDVRDAAETLLGRGLNPTIQRVRELLGTGSNTTISEHLKSWQRQLAETPKIVLPPTAPEAVATAFDSFWKVAVQHAEAAFDEQRIAAAQAVETAERARDAAIAEQGQIRAELNGLNRKLEAVQTAARELADRLLVEQERRAAAEMTIQAAEQRARAAAETVAQIRAETEARVEQLEIALRQSRADAERQEAEARRQLEAERQRGEANEIRLTRILEQSRSEWAAERQAFATERLDWKNRETAWQVRAETQEREHTSIREALAVANERQHSLSTELQQLKTGLQEGEARYLEALRTAENLRGELKAALESQKNLRQQLDRERQNRPERKAAPKSK